MGGERISGEFLIGENDNEVRNDGIRLINQKLIDLVRLE